jgi:cation-transporting ATPase 13A3/4/5
MSALRAADVGVSLCDAETSVAAPITSKMQTPGSVIDVLLEGRCSLVTAYVLVIYMILYGIIQLFMALILYSFGLIPSDYTYLIQDLFFTLVLGIAVALTERADELSWQLPPKRFLVWWLLFKLFSQMAAFIFFQIMAIYLLQLQSWYVPYTTDTPLVDSYAYESTVVANVALSQLMIGSVVATIGAPFRKAWYTNFWHVLALFLQAGWVSYQLFQTGDAFATTWLYLEPLPFDFSLILLGLIGANAAVSTGLYYVAECFRPAAKRKIQPHLAEMEIAASSIALERIKLDEAQASSLASFAAAAAAAPSSKSDSDSSPLLQ